MFMLHVKEKLEKIEERQSGQRVGRIEKGLACMNKSGKFVACDAEWGCDVGEIGRGC